VTKLTSPKEPQVEAPSKLTEHHPLKSLVYPFEVIVSPFKAFKEIAQNPDFKGLILLVGLLLIAIAGMHFTVASKIFLTLYTPPSSLLATNLFTSFLLSNIVTNAFAFLLGWLIYTFALLLSSRVFGEKGGPWRPFFILVGYAFSVFIIRDAVSTVLISTLPTINFPLKTWPPATQDEVTLASDQINTTWGSVLMFQAGTYFNLLIDAWLVMLGVIAVHASREITWRKAGMISVTAYIIYYIVRLFIGF